MRQGWTGPDCFAALETAPAFHRSMEVISFRMIGHSEVISNGSTARHLTHPDNGEQKYQNWGICFVQQERV
jgi:hypothetical protein